MLSKIDFLFFLKYLAVPDNEAIWPRSILWGKVVDYKFESLRGHGTTHVIYGSHSSPCPEMFLLHLSAWVEGLTQPPVALAPAIPNLFLSSSGTTGFWGIRGQACTQSPALL